MSLFGDQNKEGHIAMLSRIHGAARFHPSDSFKMAPGQIVPYEAPVNPPQTVCPNCDKYIGFDINKTAVDSIFICECGRRVMRTDVK